MSSQFTAIRKDSVMCTVQSCPNVATFVFTGAIDCNSGGRSLVAAFCDDHAEQASVQLGHPSPVAERRPPERQSQTFFSQSSCKASG